MRATGHCMDRDDAAMTYDFLDEFAGPEAGMKAHACSVSPALASSTTTACQTAMRAGHARICADVTTLPAPHLQGIPGWASPPCQAWSMAGNRLGEADRAACHQLGPHRSRRRPTDWREWADPAHPWSPIPSPASATCGPSGCAGGSAERRATLGAHRPRPPRMGIFGGRATRWRLTTGCRRPRCGAS